MKSSFTPNSLPNVLALSYGLTVRTRRLSREAEKMREEVRSATEITVNAWWTISAAEEDMLTDRQADRQSCITVKVNAKIVHAPACRLSAIVFRRRVPFRGFGA